MLYFITLKENIRINKGFKNLNVCLIPNYQKVCFIE